MGIAETALEKALVSAERWIRDASRTRKANAKSCVKYLKAAQAAIEGLETEVDEILSDCKSVALYHWEKRPELHDRIDRYLTRDRLRLTLAKTLKGMKNCHKCAQEEAATFWQTSRSQSKKETATQSLLDLIGEVNLYLESLAGAMAFSKENFAGPSGIDLEELIEIQKSLSPKKVKSNDNQVRRNLVEVVEMCQSKRKRRGLGLVSKAVSVSHDLQVAFRAWDDDQEDNAKTKVTDS